MTRTFCFGDAPELLRHMHATVREAVKRSTEAIRTGVNGKQVWEAACDAIEAGGYRTERSVADGRVARRGLLPRPRPRRRASRCTRPRAWASRATT